jgi:hypothetical protein
MSQKKPFDAPGVCWSVWYQVEDPEVWCSTEEWIRVIHNGLYLERKRSRALGDSPWDDSEEQRSEKLLAKIADEQESSSGLLAIALLCSLLGIGSFLLTWGLGLSFLASAGIGVLTLAVSFIIGIIAVGVLEGIAGVSKDVWR